MSPRATAESQPIALGVSKSVVIDLPRDIRDVLVADPKIANAVVRSSRRAYIIGTAVGQTNVFFFDADGKQIAGFDIAVTRDLNGIRSAIQQVLPDADIRSKVSATASFSPASVSSQAEAQQAYDIAARLVGAGSNDAVPQGNKIVNAIVVRGRDQIMLKVTVAEVERDVIKQLGINLSGSLELRHGGGQFQQHQPVLGLSASRSAARRASPARSNRSPPRCRPWSRPASFTRSPSRT